MPQQQPTSGGQQVPRKAPFIRVLGTVVGVGLVCAAVVWLAFFRSPADKPLTAKVAVYVLSSAGSPLRVGDLGAVPVRGGQRLGLEISYDQPAHTCIVWLDAKGNALPLYPWNMDDLQVNGFTPVPTDTRSGKHLRSPAIIGAGWPIGKGQGLETVLILARRAPLGPDIKLDGLLASFPPTKLRHREEAAILTWSRQSKQVISDLAMHRGTDAEAKEADAALLALMAKLGEHFDLIQAVRFAHEGEP